MDDDDEGYLVDVMDDDKDYLVGVMGDDDDEDYLFGVMDDDDDEDYLFGVMDDEGYLMRRSDLEASVLVHGVQLLRRVTVPEPLLFAAHIPERRSLVSVDCAGTVRLYYEDGRFCCSQQLVWPVSGLLYAAALQYYVAWTQHELLLFDGSFLFLSRSPVPRGVSSCVYHPGRNLVLSAGCGGVIAWSFGHSGCSLVQHQSLSEGMTEEDTVTALTIDSTAPHLHMCYAACRTNVWEYDLHDGTLRRVRRHLHARVISSLLYSEQLHLLISGSRDGSIKVWDNETQLVAVFVGHTGPITALSLTSSGTVLVSGSEDASLRTWDLNTQEQMEEHRVSGSLLGLNTFHNSEDCIVSYSHHEMLVWQAQHWYQLHSQLGTAVTAMTVCEDLSPSRVLCICADGTVRLISSATGELITTLHGGARVLGAEYCASQGAVYALLVDGHLLEASVLTSPMSVVSRVKIRNSQSPPCCFSLFCRSDKEAAGQHEDGSKEKEDSPSTRNKHRFFCLIGLEDGRLQVYTRCSDQLQCEVAAHIPGQVNCLMSDPENNYVISAGSDLMVKVWRFFPYSEESLSICLSFYCTQQVEHMCSLNSRLFVAFHDSSSATYTLVQYCLKTGTRSDHPSSYDHQDQITGVCASPGLGLVASCGRDGNIRIWTEENRLLRILCLNASPESFVFCSSRGDLLVGIHGHVYRISLMRVLPRPYKLKIMCMAPLPDVVSSQTPEYMGDMKRRTQPSSLPLRNTLDFLQDSVENTGQKEEECLLLRSRDQEIHLIQTGKLKSCKRIKGSEETRREAMEKYLQLLYLEKARYKIPDQDAFDPEELLTTSGVQKPKKTQFVPLLKDHGFFTDSALGFSISSLPQHLQVSFLAAGVLPNSALLQLLWPIKTEENLRPIKKRDGLQLGLTQPLKLTDKSEVEKENRSKETEEPTEEAAAETTEEAAAETTEEAAAETTEEAAAETTEEAAAETDDLEKIPSLLQDILATVNARKVSPPASETSSPPLQSPPAQSPKQTRSIGPQKTWKLSRIPRPRAVQKKSFPKPFVPVQFPPPRPLLSPPADVVDKPCPSLSVTCEEEEPPVRSPEKSEGPRVPSFILQFQDQSWFSLVLPVAEAQYPDFEFRLLQAFLQAEPPVCTQLLHALQTLHQQGHLRYPQRVYQTLRDVISRQTDLMVSEEPEFVCLCLRFMGDLSRRSEELIVELLVKCVQLQALHKEQVITLLHEFGVHDPRGFIVQKCNSWDSWDEAENKREALRAICGDWLRLWTDRLVDHLQAATTQNKEKWGSHGGKSVTCPPERSQGGTRTRRQEPQERLLYDVTPIHVLNYYCDVQIKRELLGLRDREPGYGSTVLALPPIDRGRAVLRLGETGMHGKQRPQAGGNFPAVLPPHRSDIIPFINLPVKKVTLSPFSGTEDTSAGPHFTDIHRYFIVQQSYIERY
ncbi:WD repeat-containing protein 97 [Hyla sarda]|uniref:WD repeat-containing protein 97 n=1 Tax=Hyla sarda TaxID=327740 RepID=UPI0024C2B0AA|nr:WD repeat-containing protein 97 [Hyla sarda]